MNEMKKRYATLATCLMVALGGVGATGCGDDDGEGVGEEAGQELDQAGEAAGQEIEEAGEDIDAETDDGNKDN